KSRSLISSLAGPSPRESRRCCQCSRFQIRSSGPRRRLRPTRLFTVSGIPTRLKAFGVYMAASLGFEPRQRDPESLVLPLHHEAKAAKANAKFANPKFEVSRRSRELTRIS